MTLVILYGPPAVGKLTVGTELARLTGFKLFHNHLTIDAVRSLFERGTPPFKQTLRQIRVDLFETAAKHQLSGLVFTFVHYNSPDQHAFFERAIERLRPYDGELLFVQLTCAVHERRQRVTNEDRSRHGKINDLETFEHVQTTKTLDARVPFEPNVTFDTTNTSPLQVAQQIQAHYHLPSIHEEGHDSEYPN